MSDGLTWVQRVQRWLPLALIAVVLLSYRNSYSGVFVFDDTGIIQTNPKVQHLWPLWDAVLRPTRWLADISYAVNFAIGGMNPADFHAGNVLIHLGATLLLFGLIRRMLNLPFWAGRWDGCSPFLAAAIAGIWGAHPLQTESVTYIVQRDESLMGFFFLLTLYCYVRTVTSPRPRLWVDVSLLTCLIGMGTKEMMVAIPILVPLFDGIFVFSSWRDAFARRWKVYLAFGLLWGVFFIQLLHINPAEIGLEAAQGYHGFTRGEYLLTQFEVIPHYLRLVFYPVGQCLDYMWLPTESLWVWVWPGIVLWGIIGAAAIGVLMRKPIGWVAAAFLLILAPTSSLMPLPDPAVEHRMYLPLAAVLVFIGVGGYAVLERILKSRPPRWRPWGVSLGVGVCLVAVAILGTMTYQRNLDYLSEFRMWQDVVEKRPDNWRAYLAVSKSLLQCGQFEKTIEWVDRFKRKIPDYASFTDAEIAALKDAPTRARVRATYFTMIENNVGVAKSQLGRVDEALVHYRTVLRFTPDDKEALNNIGYELFLRGATNDAVRHWFAALNADPNNAPAHAFLAMIYEDRQQWANAIHHYQAVLAENPSHVVYQYRLGWLLATAEDAQLRDSAQAWALAQSVMRATEGKSVKVWDLLGILYADRGDFGQALNCVDKALALMPPEEEAQKTNSVTRTNLDRELLKRSDLEDRRKLYQSSRPYYLQPTSFAVTGSEIPEH
jgi:tetratricopeptide (TPR) repeat protein